MKLQWTFLVGVLFALVVAIFAVINVNDVTVNYLFGKAEWPLVLVILGSVMMGALIAGLVSMVRIYALQRKIKGLEKSQSHEITENIIEE